MSEVPFVVGQWVRAEKFYGRSSLIREILEGPRNWLWVLGTRRSGKTSLLRQVEYVTEPEGSGYFPLFWDLQGAASPRELHLSFHDALLDAEERFSSVGVGIEQGQDLDLFSSLGRIRRQLRTSGRRLLLLCDEVEELIGLGKLDPSLLGKLRHAMQSTTDLRSVLASTIRLWALTQQTSDTSPFLHGFTPPLYIESLSDEEARALIAQAQLPNESRPGIDKSTVDRIKDVCDNHPYLIQVLCKSFLELESLDEAIEQVAGDPMISYFFSVDFEMLTESEKRILSVIAGQGASSSNLRHGELSQDSSTVGASLHRLEHLGYLRRDQERRFTLANYFFRRWLGVRKDDLRVNQRALESTLSIKTQPRQLDGRYDLLERVGSGAQGVVYKALDKLLGATVAIKVLKPESTVNGESVDRLRREIILARDIAHPNVVRMYHLGESDGMTYLIMQWIDGPVLSKLIAQNGPLQLSYAIQIAEKTASALAAAHAIKVLHRDIKASNILIDSAGEPHLADFGLAQLIADTTQTGQGIFLGTPDYASPEQAEGRPLDERSDIYSLGVVMFEMVTGRRPFIGRSVGEVLELHRKGIPPDPSVLRPEIPEPLSRLILDCLEKDAVRRPQKAWILGAALQKIH
jgi:hypothetical protein